MWHCTYFIALSQAKRLSHSTACDLNIIVLSRLRTQIVPSDMMMACSWLRTAVLAVAACGLLTGAGASFVMLGDSFSDDGRGANPVVQEALSQDGVRCRSLFAACACNCGCRNTLGPLVNQLLHLRSTCTLAVCGRPISISSLLQGPFLQRPRVDRDSRSYLRR